MLKVNRDKRSSGAQACASYYPALMRRVGRHITKCNTHRGVHGLNGHLVSQCMAGAAVGNPAAAAAAAAVAAAAADYRARIDTYSQICTFRVVETRSIRFLSDNRALGVQAGCNGNIRQTFWLCHALPELLASPSPPQSDPKCSSLFDHATSLAASRPTRQGFFARNGGNRKTPYCRKHCRPRGGRSCSTCVGPAQGCHSSCHNDQKSSLRSTETAESLPACLRRWSNESTGTSGIRRSYRTPTIL